jgi:hypothetical protein
MAWSSIKHYTVELYLSGLIGMVSHPDMKKIQIIGFGGYLLQCVPVSKPFDHAWFEALEAITLYCTWSNNQ